MSALTATRSLRPSTSRCTLDRSARDFVQPTGRRKRPSTLPARLANSRTFHSSASLLAQVAPTRAKDFDRSTLRNVSFWGHIDAGKTTLTEKVLYHANALSPPAADDVASPNEGKKSHARQLPGDVDSGSTVTDFLEAERQRGITIQSAAVGPFFWETSAGASGNKQKNAAKDSPPRVGVPSSSQITLVDTPGHIDFTIEVERSLRVADGCVVLIDAVEGVENQTEGVWRIAQRYNVRSHIAFINKLDRTGASLSRSIRSIVAKGLHARPTLLQLPIVRAGASGSVTDQAELAGLVDLTSRPVMAQFFAGRVGEETESMTLEQAVANGRAAKELVEEADKARNHLIETVAGQDEQLLEHVLGIEPADGKPNPSQSVATNDLRQAIRRATARGDILPVLCGSAQKALGVQPVLDAISWYLPSPGEAGDFDAAASRDKTSGCVWAETGVQKRNSQLTADEPTGVEGGDAISPAAKTAVSVDDGAFSALAFKVVYDKRRGPLTYVRVYSGTLSRACALYNTATKSKERLNKIFFAYADRLVETEKIEAGQIGVLIGLRDTRTGDTLVDTRGASSSKDKVPWAGDASSLALRQIDVPPPVFSLSLEPLGKADEGKLREALDQLIRTDPSLHIDYGDSTGQRGSGGLGSVAASGGQMILSGMGELHLEIAKDRLLNEFGRRAHIGQVRVSYRETAKRLVDDAAAKDQRTLVEHTFEKDVMGTPLKASCRLTLRTLSSMEEHEGNAARFDDNIIDIELTGTSVGQGDGMEAKMPGPDDEEAAPADMLGEDAVRSAIQSGLNAALSRGPMSGSPLQGLYIRISNVKAYGPQLTTVKALSMMASDALRTALRQRGSTLMEPVMDVTTRCDEEHVGKVVSDLSSVQGGTIEHVEHEVDNQLGDESAATQDILANIYTPPPFVEGHVSTSDTAMASESQSTGRGKATISAAVPLIRLVQYSSRLRALTRGSGTFEMRFRGFAVASPNREHEILTELGRM